MLTGADALERVNHVILISKLQARVAALEAELAQQTHNSATDEICECEYCNDTGYLSADGKSVQANEHSPCWKYCPYCSRKLSAVR